MEEVVEKIDAEEEVVEKEVVCLWHLGEELRDLGAPRANPVIHLARISQNNQTYFLQPHNRICFSQLKNA